MHVQYHDGVLLASFLLPVQFHMYSLPSFSLGDKKKTFDIMPPDTCQACQALLINKDDSEDVARW
jgi:hypothetical protein